MRVHAQSLQVVVLEAVGGPQGLNLLSDNMLFQFTMYRQPVVVPRSGGGVLPPKTVLQWRRRKLKLKTRGIDIRRLPPEFFTTSSLHAPVVALADAIVLRSERRGAVAWGINVEGLKGVLTAEAMDALMEWVDCIAALVEDITPPRSWRTASTVATSVAATTAAPSPTTESPLSLGPSVSEQGSHSGDTPLLELVLLRNREQDEASGTPPPSSTCVRVWCLFVGAISFSALCTSCLTRICT